MLHLILAIQLDTVKYILDVELQLELELQLALQSAAHMAVGRLMAILEQLRLEIAIR